MTRSPAHPRIPTPPRSSQTELLDMPETVAAELGANLADIRRLNAWFGGTALALRCARPLVRSGVRSWLDVATGSGDIPLALYRWSERANISLRIEGLDLSSEVLGHAQDVVGAVPITMRVGDARELPYAAGEFDVVSCCLALHHFEPTDARLVLSEMWRVARTAVVVVDLTRSYPGHVGAWLATRTVARNRLTQHDGPLSVLRAYTPHELAALAHESGVTGYTVKRYPFFRQALVARKGVPGG